MKNQKRTSIEYFAHPARDGAEIRQLNCHVVHFDRIRRSGFETLCLQTTIHLMEQGFITTINHEPDHEVIGILDDDGQALAFICYEVRESQELAHVIIGGVTDFYRGDGLYLKLWEYLVYWLKRNPHVKKITGCYHVDNKSSARMNEKLGRKPVRVTTEFDLHGE